MLSLRLDQATQRTHTRILHCLVGLSSVFNMVLARSKSLIYSYFRSKFDIDLKVSMEAFKAARYFSPLKLAELQPTVADLDALFFLPFLNSNDITTLKSELSTYIAAVEDISKSIDPLEWWESNEERLPNWASAFKKHVLVQPSSAAAERASLFFQVFFKASN